MAMAVIGFSPRLRRFLVLWAKYTLDLRFSSYFKLYANCIADFPTNYTLEFLNLIKGNMSN